MQKIKNKPPLLSYLKSVFTKKKKYHIEQDYFNIITFIYIIVFGIIYGWHIIDIKNFISRMPFPLTIILPIFYTVILLFLSLIIIYSLNWLVSTFSNNDDFRE